MNARFLFPVILILSIIFFSCEKADDGASDFSSADIELIQSGNAETLMRVLNYYIHEDSLILRKYSSDIQDFDNPLLAVLISRMYKTVRDPQHPGVGIACPQIGINKRIIWVQRYDITGKPFECYLNAKITKYSDTLVALSDGCLSIPNTGGSSWRALWVDVEYYTRDGVFHQERISHQYTAHIFQHEIDHLNGMVYLDRLVAKNPKNIVLMPTQPYPIASSALPM